MNTLSNSLKHSYPLKIALRAQNLIQGSLFYDVFTDTATWLYAKNVPNAEQTIKNFLIKSAGWSEETYEISWGCFENLMKEYQSPIYHHTVYSIISHWDWYISNLGKFVEFAEKSTSPEKQTNKELLKLNSKPFQRQIEIIKNQTEIILNIDDDTLNLVEEMHLVRNLGMHNEWEVDDTYLKLSKTKKYKLGDKRIIEKSEITEWHYAFIQLINAISSEIAVRYGKVPDYE